ncbi:arylsulfatase [Halopseudomonas sabulinigri]|uniref:Arylsulfatase AtsA n=1 Tax=Halopseudomonas sabulinigri TaxID=472181 RepID=A0ABP9ZT97_9GAMM
MFRFCALSRGCLKLSILLLCTLTAVTAQARSEEPNVLFIVADDLGFSDISPFGGSEIHTPNLQRLAEQGVAFTNFHTLPTCAPTRSVLLTGADNHLAGKGAQVITPEQQGHDGYEGHLNDRVTTLAEVLGKAGYRTYFSGKWHLGDEPEYAPFNRGFQESFALLPGGASHYADMRPLHPAEPVVYTRNGKIVDSLPADFYSTRNYTDYLIDWLQRDAASDQPFFAYLAYTAPHDPLQAPEEYIRKYDGVYDEGYGKLRAERYERLKALGVFADVPLPPWPELIAEWDSLPESEKALRRRDMQIYAAMIDYMDEQIGRVLDVLQQQGQLDNTLIVFLSDNGANGTPPKIYPAHTRAFHESFDNSVENRGAPGSFASQGPGWATASGGGLNLFKYFVYEGGIRTPAIMVLPGAQQAGIRSAAFTHVRDIVPTVLDAVHLVHPGQQDSSLAPLEGRTLLPLLRGKTASTTPYEVGYELHGSRAYIRDNWKVVQSAIPAGTGQWQLFDLSSDPAEVNDLAGEYPERLAALKRAQAAYEQKNGVIYSPPGFIRKAQMLSAILLCLLAAGALLQILLQLRAGSTRSVLRLLSAGIRIALSAALLMDWRIGLFYLLCGLQLIDLLMALRGQRWLRALLGGGLLLLVVALVCLLHSGLGLWVLLQDY